MSKKNRKEENRRYRLKHKDKIKAHKKEYYESRVKDKIRIKTGYVVQIDGIDVSFVNPFFYNSRDEYKHLKFLRTKYKEVIAANPECYKVFKIKQSKFHLVPHEPDETKHGMYHLINLENKKE